MGFDRFVHWTDEKPTFGKLRTVLEDYIGLAGEVTFDDHWLWVKLHGAPSFPFKRLLPDSNRTKYFEELAHDPRCFDVFVAEDHIDVITRFTDEYTNVVAEGFAVLAARFWKGKRDEI